MQCKLFFHVSLQILILKGGKKTQRKRKALMCKKCMKPQLKPSFELKYIVCVKKALDLTRQK